MVKLTENKVAEIDTSALEKRARDIRDAVVTKSVTVEMVGSLFADLITACGNVRDALALFLGTNVQEITSDIDNRLAGVAGSGQTAANTTVASGSNSANTIGGLITEALGRLPEPGEHPSVQLEGVQFTVLLVEERRIARIRAERRPPEEPAEREKDKKEKN